MSILKSGIVSVVMGVVVWLAYPILGRILGDSGTLRQVLQVVGTIFVGIVVFGVRSWCLGWKRHTWCLIL